MAPAFERVNDVQRHQGLVLDNEDAPTNQGGTGHGTPTRAARRKSAEASGLFGGSRKCPNLLIAPQECAANVTINHAKAGSDQPHQTRCCTTNNILRRHIVTVCRHMNYPFGCGRRSPLTTAPDCAGPRTRRRSAFDRRWVAARNVVDYRVEPVGLEAHQAHQVATRLALRAML